ncbi:hypothetical protein DMB66_37950 [Actinoplanes sp. ATCC 53533]|uniref:2'-5' RNA ligase family protein n=1 Tax=Actinoplanes sp. ATCC 53533 TaxID=1288362 RepID=UPI000F77F26D|nr:2'-5' RNA ligase family protein [Actinoplanes sp. ATCC 53533]RSM53964.1 hypothetical protein DMB66_37950 [Actinoplanes sp. ATCC 53533]
MRRFADTLWSPTGSRPHIEVPASPQVAGLAAAYVAQSRAWWDEQNDERDFDEVFEVVNTPFLHMTVAWLDMLSTSLSPGQFDTLHDTLARRLAALAPFEVRVGPATVGLYAVELYIVPNTQANELAGHARAALREVFGETAAPEPRPVRPWRAHVTAMYGRQRVDTDALASRLAYTTSPEGQGLLAPVTMTVDHVLLVDQDTWGPDGLAWNQHTARTVALGRR